jgi:hypothetical protein
MNRPDAGDTLFPNDEPPTEEIAVSSEAAAWLNEELADLRERLMVLESGSGRNRAVLVLRGICAVVGATAALLGVGLVLLTCEQTELTGWALALCVVLAGGICALPALVALGLEDELVEITRLALAAWGERRTVPVMMPASPPTAPPWPPTGAPPGWRGP